MLLATIALTGTATALELEERGRWVEDAAVEIGGGSVLLRSGVVFPLDHDGAAGFVFVGDAVFTAPLASPGDALAVRAAVPEAAIGAGWTEEADRVVAFGRHPGLLAAASLGHPLGDDPDALTWVDEQGREHVEVTGLRPREALTRARAALARRADALDGVNLDPERMLALDAHRGGAPRAIVEVEPEHDLRALVAARDDRADLARPWLTWVVDPAGVVDDRYGSVLAVHGPTPEGRAWRVVSGVVRVGPGELTVERGAANVVLERGPGIAATARIEAQVELTAHAPTRLVDLWIPRSEPAPNPSALTAWDDVELTRLEVRRDGVAAPLEVLGPSFGPRAPRSGWLPVTLLLPRVVEADERLTLRIDAVQDVDIGQVIAAQELVVAVLDGAPPPKGVPETLTLGRVMAERPALPVLATDARPYPAELRAGTAVIGWKLAAGAAAARIDHQDGRLWTATVPSTTTFSGGELDESRDRPALGFPGVRLLSHTFVDPRVPARIRSVLNFYDPALPPWPYDEVVMVQAPERPVVTVAMRTAEPLRTVVPTIRSMGGGQLALEGLLEIPVGSSGQLQQMVDGQWPHALERALAEAVASAWWERLPWSDHDRWLARALPAVYRDRFVDEAWDEDIVRRWATFGDELIAKGAPPGDLAPLAGVDAAWAGEVGARLVGGAVRERIGEEALLEGLHRFLDAGEPTLARLVTELEDVGGVSLAGTFDAFAVAGLRPRIDGRAIRERDGLVITLVADPPLGTYDVPLVYQGRRGRAVAWVRMVHGRGTAELPARVEDLEIDPDHHLPVWGGRIRAVETVSAR